MTKNIVILTLLAAVVGSSAAVAQTSACVQPTACGAGQVSSWNGSAWVCKTIYLNFTQLAIAYGSYGGGGGTRNVYCATGYTRISCGLYTNPGGDGNTHIFQNPVVPISPNGCQLNSAEGSDAWAVTAYCLPSLP